MILVRHAQSEWNLHYGRTRLDPGIPDPPLTAAGRRQARALAHELRAQEVRRIVASPYRRALETATLLAESLALAIEVEPLVRERCAFSCDEGSAPARLALLWPALAFNHLGERWWGGAVESEASLLARCAAFRRASDAFADREGVLVVSHWGFIRGMTGQELANAAFLRLP